MHPSPKLEARVRRRHASARGLQWLIALVLLATTLAAPPAHADRDDDAADDDVELGTENELEAADLDGPIDAAVGASRVVDRSRAQLPQIADVLEAAYAAAGLAHDPTRSWRRRARAAGLIPWVSARVGWDASWRDHEPGDVGRRRDFEVRATWRLDRLLFDGRELQASTIDAARRRERRRLATRVIRTYFAWRKVTAAAARDPRFALAAEAATAELDALTDGWFSDRTKSRR